MRKESRHAMYGDGDSSLHIARGGKGGPQVAKHDDGQVSRDSVRELSHDLRHPCATIRALAAAIEIEAELPEAAANRLRQIVAEARRVEELCNQVLASSARGTGLTRIDRVVRDIVAAHPRISCATVPLVARIDELDVRRILWNLIDNAVRATGPEGEVLVSAWSTDDHVVLAVADNGPGFGTAPPGAAGLGLNIVGALAERAGGRVEIGVGGASTGVEVRIVLPHPRHAPSSFEREAAVSGDRS